MILLLCCREKILGLGWLIRLPIHNSIEMAAGILKGHPCGKLQVFNSKLILTAKPQHSMETDTRQWETSQFHPRFSWLTGRLWIFCSCHCFWDKNTVVSWTAMRTRQLVGKLLRRGPTQAAELFYVKIKMQCLSWHRKSCHLLSPYSGVDFQYDSAHKKKKKSLSVVQPKSNNPLSCVTGGCTQRPSSIWGDSQTKPHCQDLPKGRFSVITRDVAGTRPQKTAAIGAKKAPVEQTADIARLSSSVSHPTQKQIRPGNS